MNELIIPILIAVVAIVCIGLCIVIYSLSKLKRKYKQFIGTTSAVDFEGVLIDNQKKIAELFKNQQELEIDIEKIFSNLKRTFEKVAMLKYDAFEGMGAQLSAVIVLLNNNNDGFLLNSIHSREGSHMYVKEIIKGKTEQALSKEEENTIKVAIKKS